MLDKILFAQTYPYLHESELKFSLKGSHSLCYSGNKLDSSISSKLYLGSEQQQWISEYLHLVWWENLTVEHFSSLKMSFKSGNGIWFYEYPQQNFCEQGREEPHKELFESLFKSEYLDTSSKQPCSLNLLIYSSSRRAVWNLFVVLLSHHKHRSIF